MNFFAQTKKIALKQLFKNVPNLAKIDQNRANVVFFCLETRINCYLYICIPSFCQTGNLLKFINYSNYGKFKEMKLEKKSRDKTKQKV